MPLAASAAAMKFLEGLRGGGRVLGNVANEPYRPQVPHEAATRGPRANFTLTSHGRTTKKNTGSSTPMATLPM